MDSYLVEFFSSYWLQIIIAIAIAYLCGSVNSSIIITRIVMNKDIRTMGSGNAGFTNVLRCVGKIPAILTFVGDFLKGVIAVLVAYLLMLGVTGDNAELFKGYIAYISGLFVVMGHMFPCFYKFKGGKGVVTTAAVILMVDWRMLIVALIIFAIIFAITKTISKCALINAALFPISNLCFKLLDYYRITDFISPLPNPSVSFIVLTTVVSLILAILVIVRHKDNIKRILNGTEKKITAKK